MGADPSARISTTTSKLLGNGDTPMVHHPQYVFNDDILPMGAAYWVALTEQYLR